MEQNIIFYIKVTLHLVTLLLIQITETAKLPLLGIGNMREVLEIDRIVPDILPEASLRTGVAEVTYITNASDPSTFHVVNFGNQISKDIYKNPPHLKWFPEWDRLYTVIFTDADANPNSTLRERQLWVIGNCVSNFYDEGETLTKYAGPELTKDSGLHRIVIGVFKQKGQIDFKEKIITAPHDEHRQNFSTPKFVEKYKLGDLYAANYFTASYDGNDTHFMPE